MNKEVFKQKVKDHKILIILISLTSLTGLVGVYYNLFRENKQTFHYTFKNGPEREYSLFFQRVSDQPEEKNVVSQVFNYKYGSIVNLRENKAYYIFNSPYDSVDKIYEYDFQNKEGLVIFENNEKLTILDTYLIKNSLYILANNRLIKFDLETKRTETLFENFDDSNPESLANEFINHTNNEFAVTNDFCKFSVVKCESKGDKYAFVLNLTTKEVKKSKLTDLDPKFNQMTEFFGTNKVYRRGILRKYEKDEGNKNYNLRIFTQF